ncbi:putative prokineticin receptor 2-like [Apostichopus japonicus]|uniref:Putative prokineticin receptor 2-like n=2 Tax=Stichopus japonicus TaxID=307972 RepID=A0A2G8KL69_STIJA|nr:putative prokineticin receptor 2-like [Apostichopus japonicus]
MQKATLATIVVSIWVVSVLITIPNSINLGLVEGKCNGQDIAACYAHWKDQTASQVYTVIIAVMEFIVPMVCMGFVYMSIALKLWFHRTPPGNVTARHREITVNRQQKTIPMLITVVVAFFICWAPYHTYMTVYQFKTADIDANRRDEYTYFYIVEGIAMCNSIVSTVIYFAMSTGFRKELINFMKRVLSWPYKDRHHSPPSCSQSSNALARNGYPSAGRKITADTLDTKL